MKPAAKFAIVLVTAPDLKTARALAKAALSARLIACANLVPKIESHYRWQGKIESSAEVLLILKTQIKTGRAGKTGSRQTSLRHAGVSGFAGERGQ
jgi:uncharacterized protein involved in tolerance to divalent cations